MCVCVEQDVRDYYTLCKGRMAWNEPLLPGLWKFMDDSHKHTLLRLLNNCHVELCFGSSRLPISRFVPYP